MSDQDFKKQVEYRGTGFYVSLVFIVLGVIALIIIAIQNTETVPFEFLGWVFEIPLFGLVFIAALLAVTIDELVGLVWRRSRRLRLTEKQELERLRKESAPSGTTDTQTETSAEIPDEDPSVDDGETPGSRFDPQ